MTGGIVIARTNAPKKPVLLVAKKSPLNLPKLINKANGNGGAKNFGNTP